MRKEVKIIFIVCILLAGVVFVSGCTQLSNVMTPQGSGQLATTIGSAVQNVGSLFQGIGKAVGK